LDIPDEEIMARGSSASWAIKTATPILVRSWVPGSFFMLSSQESAGSHPVHISMLVCGSDHCNESWISWYRSFSPSKGQYSVQSWKFLCRALHVCCLSFIDCLVRHICFLFTNFHHQSSIPIAPFQETANSLNILRRKWFLNEHATQHLWFLGLLPFGLQFVATISVPMSIYNYLLYPCSQPIKPSEYRRAFEVSETVANRYE
jgi:hypothetical protein